MDYRLKGEHGFSLIEVLVALSVVMLLVAMMSGFFRGITYYNMSQETKHRMELIKQALIVAYQQDAWVVDSEVGGQINLTGGTITSGRTDAATFKAIENAAQLPAAKLQYDGFNAPWQVFISRRLMANVDGVSIPYHRMAIVSAGPDGEVTTTFSASGEVVRPAESDDQYTVIDGLSIQREIYKENLATLNKLSQSYQQYFQSRYLSDPERTIGRNYFAGGGPYWDQQDGALAQVDVYADISKIANVLGLAISDTKDAYRQTIQYVNAGMTTRNPDHPTLNTPPYSALLRSKIPGGGEIVKSVAGLY